MTFTKIDVALNYRDTFGNELMTKEIQDGVWDIKLRQHNESRWRSIGQLIAGEEEVMYFKTEKEEDMYRNTKAWSIHALILDHCDTVQYSTPLGKYTIPTRDAKHFGGKFTYKNNALTTKVIVPIRHWDIKCTDSNDTSPLKKLGFEWFDELRGEFRKPYMQQLSKFVAQQRKITTVYPSGENIFRAFQMTPFLDVRVVIIGQDPYHGEGEANGLAFAVNQGTLKIPPSLLNINKELEDDYEGGFTLYKRVDLENWARQGVLLINTSLTVEKDKPGSHSGIGWQTFTTEAIRRLVVRKGNPIVFMLWGKHAQSLQPVIEGSQHLILTAPHPSPFSAHTGFFGCKHFTKCNNLLKKTGQGSITW
jgi:uracil-DNA glycosylase